MSKSQNLLRKIFLQKKLIQKQQHYPYTYIFQYNNISANDWKKIKNIIHNVQNLEKMNLQVVPSKLRKPLKNSSSFLNKIRDSQGSSAHPLKTLSLQPTFSFSKIKGSCCILNCHTVQDLEMFYKIICQSLDKKEFNTSLSTSMNSFIHLILQINHPELHPKISINSASSREDALKADSQKLNVFLNSLEIQKRLSLTFRSTYGEFFNTLHTKTTQIFSIPQVLNQNILFFAKKSTTN